MSEKPRFYIPPSELVKPLQIIEKLNDFSERELEEIIKDENPHLYVYIKENARGKYGNIYENAAYSTYLYIKEFLQNDSKHITFTKEDILLHRQNSKDVFQSSVYHKTGGDPIQADENTMFASFMQSLSKATPAIYNQVIAECTKTEDKLLKKAYLKGVYDGFMPFYSKLSVEIYNSLWNFEAVNPPLQELIDEPETLSIEQLDQLWFTPPRGVPYQEAENMEGPDC